jgi:hypothetical protein
MPVEEVLTRTSSRELTEWIAYERLYGPVGNEWRDELQASIHELLQFANHLKGASMTSEKQRKNQVPKVKLYPRPWGDEMDTEEGE